MVVGEKRKREKTLEKLDWEKNTLGKLDFSIKKDGIRELVVPPKKRFDIGAASAISCSSVANAVSATNMLKRPKKVVLPSLGRFVIFTLRLSRKY